MAKKNLYLLLVSFSVISIVFLSSCVPLEKEKIVKSPIIKDPISLEKNEIVIRTFFKEVMAKDEISRIDLVANKEREPFYFNLTLIVDGIRYQMNEQMKGYKPELFVNDINNDNLSDMMVTIKTGKTDNSILYGIFSFPKRVFTSLIKEDQQNGIVPLQLKWLSSRSIQIQSQTYQINTKKTVPLFDPTLVNSLIGITGYLNLEIIDDNKDFQNELKGLQLIWLSYPHQGVYKFQTVLKYLEGNWKLLEYSFLPVN